MANIVELREMNGEKLREMLANAREEMFNLRFQQASARLEDTSRIRHVRREIAQLETVLHMRQLAKNEAAAIPEIADILADEEWRATARFRYEDSAWLVEFFDENNDELANALVNLNKAQPKERKARRMKRTPRLVMSYEVVK